MLRMKSAALVLGALTLGTMALGSTALVSPAAAATSPAMDSCSAEWSKMKADNKVPAGQTWPKFWSECSKTYAAAHPDNAAKPAAMPAAAAKPAMKTTAMPADENGVAVPEPDAAAKMDTAAATTKAKKPLTPGQQAAIVRIKACGAEWQANKAAGKLPVGAKWPQYWSDCNKRLKAKGQ